jgi:hypothetical protein
VNFCPFVGDGADGYQVDVDAGSIQDVWLLMIPLTDAITSISLSPKTSTFTCPIPPIHLEPG